MSFNTSFVMSHLPIIGAVVTFVMFFLLMRLCIRKIDQEEELAEQADWWDDEEGLGRSPHFKTAGMNGAGVS